MILQTNQRRSSVSQEHSLRPDSVLDDLVQMMHGLCETVNEIKAKLDGGVKEYYTVEEIARFTNRAPYTVREWIKGGRIKAERVVGSGPKGRLLIARTELTKLIAAGKNPNVPGVAVVDKA